MTAQCPICGKHVEFIIAHVRHQHTDYDKCLKECSGNNKYFNRTGIKFMYNAKAKELMQKAREKVVK